MRGYSASALGRASGVGVATLRKLEDGRSNPGILTVVAIVDALGASLDTLLENARGMAARVRLVRAGATDLCRQNPATRLTSFEIELAGGDNLQAPTDELGEGNALCVVLAGSIKVERTDGGMSHLAADDSFRCRPGAIVAWGGASDGPARLLCVVDQGNHAGERSARSDTLDEGEHDNA